MAGEKKSYVRIIESDFSDIVAICDAENIKCGKRRLTLNRVFESTVARLLNLGGFVTSFSTLTFDVLNIKNIDIQGVLSDVAVIEKQESMNQKINSVLFNTELSNDEKVAQLIAIKKK